MSVLPSAAAPPAVADQRASAGVIRMSRTGTAMQFRHAFAGSWFRQISEEHQLVHLVVGDEIVILQVREHYGQ
ncbi:MAG: type II toxin-antitoxin system YoeB family toxin [Microbacteriaceae bacterium]